MAEKETFERIRSIIIEQLGVETEEVTMEASSSQDNLEADSLDLVELIMAFEEEFGGEILDDEAPEDPDSWGRRTLSRPGQLSCTVQ